MTNISDVINTHDNDEVEFRGRIVSKRILGGAMFCDIRDLTGKIQVFIKKNNIQNFNEIETCNLGAIVEIAGTMFHTKAGEFTSNVHRITILVNPARALPLGKRTETESYHTMSNIETRYRQRYLDLWANLENRDIFIFRHNLINRFRQYLNNSNFIEIESPILETTASGASAKTFDTHYNSHNSDYHLRISLEIPLKKMLIAGFDRVYEIGKVFRNEGISARHSPEFTMIEIYQAYATLGDMKELFKQLIWCVDKDAFGEILNAPTVTYGDETGIGWEFIVDHPANISPLAKARENGTAYRFEVAYNGLEIANAYWEQNDPELQKQAFSNQRAEDSEELYVSDEEFITALQFGMPPAGGIGIGLDRLIMVLKNLPSIKDTILFPIS